jgi:hypothetical protein
MRQILDDRQERAADDQDQAVPLGRHTLITVTKRRPGASAGKSPSAYRALPEADTLIKIN